MKLYYLFLKIFYMSKIAVIGAGFSGLSASAYLSDAGHEVHLFEKNQTAGGRARQFKTEKGYVFDMGPSWYWMPDVFENFFNDFGHTVAEFYTLKKLDPSFEMVFADQKLEIPDDYHELCRLFDKLEKGSSLRLDRFMKDAEFKYKTAMENLIDMPGLSIGELFNKKLINGFLKLQIFGSLEKQLKKYFTHPKILALMEFPILFLGASAKNTPALYSLMDYAGLKLGTWYPNGGFGKVVDSIKKLSQNRGTIFHFNSPVEKILVKNNLAKGIRVNGKELSFDSIVASADYHHVESNLLTKKYRNYNAAYWQNKIFAPSCLIFFLGINKKLKSIKHHSLFFDEDIALHTSEIYSEPKWPSKPLFYCCCPSRTDDTLAPAKKENLFLLIPIAIALEDNPQQREKYFEIIMKRLEKHCGEELKSHIHYKKSYCINDFVTDYHSYNGNAYGLANTLMQTAIMKPKIRNKKIKNLFYAGQLTVPGPGVPTSLISGKIVANQTIKYLKNSKDEIIV